MTVSQPTGVSQAAGRTDGGDNRRQSVLFVCADPDNNPMGSSYPGAVKDCLTDDGWRTGLCSSSASARIEPARRLLKIKAPLTPVRHLSFVRNMAGIIPQYDVVHLFFLSGISFTRHVVPALVLGKFLGKRVALSYHRNQAEAELERSGWWMLPFFRLCNSVVVSSEYIADLFARYGLATELIPPAVDMDLFRPRKIVSVQPKLVVARSLEKRNNIACAIEAFALVKQKYPRAEMVITGDGSQRAELERLAAGEKLNGVTFTGRVSLNELSRYFAETDVYVNASSIDGLPISLLEALAVGLPVVTTGAGGIPGVINDGNNGLIVRSNDPSGLADRIIKLVESPELVQQLSEQAKLSSRDFSLAHVKEKLSDLYRCLQSTLPSSTRWG
jgi:glycosyltransferase involved in cell wall biosynthesis